VNSVSNLEKPLSGSFDRPIDIKSYDHVT